MRILVVGLGKLGAPMACVFAGANHQVVGLDYSEKIIKEFQSGRCPVEETGLNDLYQCMRQRMEFTTDYREAKYCDMSFIIVPTPSDIYDRFASTYVLEAIEKICQNLGKGYHNIVVTSTVMPGAMEREIKPLVEKVSGRKVGKDIGLNYSPEFIALGSVIKNMQYPDSVLIGQSDEKAGQQLEGIYKDVCVNNPPITRMSWWNAEVAKLMVNVFVTTKISLANTFAEICERIPGGDIDVVTDFLGLDGRIGRKFLSGGLGYGGPCVLPSTLVQTLEGLKEIKDIKENEDFVISHDGKYHKVTQVYITPYDGEMVSISPEGHRANNIITTPDHPIFGSKRKDRMNSRFYEYNDSAEGCKKTRMAPMIGRTAVDFVPASEYQQGDLLVMPSVKPPNGFIPKMHLKTHWLSYVDAETIITPELMRLFGYYIAEGSSWRKEIKFSFHKSEERYVDDIAGIIERYFGSKTKIKGRIGNGIKTRTVCSQLAKYLKSTFGDRCCNKKLPHHWLGLPDEYLIEFFRGLWYGDGSRSDNRFTLGITSKELFNQVKLICLKLHIPYHTKIYPPRIGEDGISRREAYHLIVSNPMYYKRMSEVLPELALKPHNKGKKTIWWEGDNMYYHIKDIKRIQYKGCVYNLEVEDANSYMLEGGVVHNCFPRDARAFIKVAEEFDTNSPIQSAVDSLNKLHTHYVYLRLKQISGSLNWSEIAVLGITYKPFSPIVEESIALELIRRLSYELAWTRVYDPMGMEAAAAVLHSEHPARSHKHDTGSPNILMMDSIEEALKGADACVIATPWPQFKDIKPSRFVELMRKPVVYDCWRLLDGKEMRDGGVDYYALGVNREK